MHQIAYISAAMPSVDEKDLANILASARKHNAINGVTGILMFHQGQFFQVLEGSKSAVETCFNRIQIDPRHRGVIKLFDDSTEERSFDNWTMAAVGLESCKSMLKAQLLDLFSLRDQPQYDDLKKNKVIGVFVDTFLADLHRFSDAVKLPSS